MVVLIGGYYMRNEDLNYKWGDFMKNTENLFAEIKKDGSKTNEEYAELTGIPANNVKVYISRWKSQGYLDVYGTNGDRSIKVIQDIKNKKAEAVALHNYKQEVYEEMLDIYMEDFRTASTVDDRLRLGREIRLIVEKL